MSTYNRRSTQKEGPFEGGVAHVLENTVSTVIAASDDVIEVLDIPKGYYVGNVYVEIVTASDAGSTHTLDVGDADDPNGWDNQIDAMATAGTVTSGAAGTDAYVPTGKGTFPLWAKAYASGGVIKLTGTLGTTANTVGSVKVKALCYKPLLGSY